MYDATLKIIAVAKVKANIVIPHLQLHRLAGGSATGLSATGAWVTSSRWTGPQPMIRPACA